VTGGIAIATYVCLYVSVGLAFCVAFLRPHIGTHLPRWEATTANDLWRGLAVLGTFIFWPPLAIIWTLGRITR
jgi:hypothetical protein